MSSQSPEGLPVFQDLEDVDLEMAGLIQQEAARVGTSLQLIPSENLQSSAVTQALASVLGNKYAEGYPGRRYYEGNVVTDEVERLAQARAKALFGADHANVQPLSGGPANMCVYEAVLQSGDTVLGMALDHGGHLTHGSPVNFSGKRYKFRSYGVDRENGRISYTALRELAHELRPKMIVAGATAYSREIDFAEFGNIAREIGALLLADMSHIAGLVAAGEHQNPVPHADFVTTTTHKTLRGPRGAIILCKGEYAEALDKAVFPAVQAGPHMNSIAAKAVAFHEAAQPAFREYIQGVRSNASTLARELMSRGFNVVSGGTDNHLMLVDLTNKDVTGKTAATTLDQAGIVANKNTVPFDSRSPFVTSGIRLGTPYVTSMGLGNEHMSLIADWIDRVVAEIDSEGVRGAVAAEIRELLSQFPIAQAIATSAGH